MSIKAGFNIPDPELRAMLETAPKRRRAARGQDHIVLNTQAAGRLECHYCGQTYTPAMPAPLEIYGAIMKAWTKMHRACTLPDTGLIVPTVPPRTAPASAQGTPGLFEWLATGERGISSETMVTHLTGISVIPKHNYSEPFDSADFRRCYKLLKAVPSLRDKLPRMAALSKAWAGLVERWDWLEQVHESGEESRALTNVIRQIRSVATGEK